QAELARANLWCDQACDKWYGERRRRDQHFGTAIATGQRQAEGASDLLTKLLERPIAEVPAIARATALQTLSQIDPAAAGHLSTTLVKDPHPLVRSAACEALMGHTSIGQSANVLASALQDPIRVVRTSAARNLMQFPVDQHPPATAPKLRQAVTELIEGLQNDSDRAGAHLSLAVMAEQDGRVQAAIDHYRDAIRVEPKVTGARSNLAALLERNLSQQNGDARDPESPVVQEIAGLRKVELELLARDVRLLPSAASLQYRYALALYVDGQKEKALEHLLNAAQREPMNFEYVQGVTLMYKSMSQWDKAQAWGQKLLDIAPSSQESTVRAILSEIQRQVP
ncbi:MAG: HEAT repeat domain-containing protein, partial [Pirellulaceae bacterium]|nr:HEAT repeat domain-containing protein [Pirellulaceae bacterium]